MQLRLFNAALVFAVVLPLVACTPTDPVNPILPDADEMLPVADLQTELLTDLKPIPPCGLVGGCPVDLPVVRPVVYRFWGPTANDVWAVGKGGLTLHWNGTTWLRFSNPATGDLWAVWGTASNDIWAVGENGTIIRWNGTSWSKITGLMITAGLNDIWGTAANDAWAVGESGTILHWDGTKWSLVSIPYINGFMAVWGATTKDVWIGGEAGLLLHWDGTKMNETSSGGFDTILRIRGSGTDDVYLTNDGYMGPQHWDGTKWSLMTTASGTELWVLNENHVWLAGGGGPSMGCHSYFWNGLIWTFKNGTVGAATAIWSIGSDGWIGTAAGQLARYNGTNWVSRW